MFAVPGWSVSAQSLVQEKARPSKLESKHSTVNNDNSSQKHKKRKLVHNDVSETTITGDDLEKFWANRFESKTDKKLKKSALEDANLNDRDVHSTDPSKKVKTSQLPVVVDKQDDRSSRREKSKKKTRPDTQASQEKKEQHGTAQDIPMKKEKGPDHSTSLSSSNKLTPLQAKMRNKLTSARFRHLNQTLYTTSSTAAMELFTTSPDLFAEYHAGFAQQVKDSWPRNPVDEYVNAIKTRGKDTDQNESSKKGLLPLPRRKTGSCTIADLGCGDAPLVRGCQSHIKALKLKFHNFDLHAPNSQVTKADISNLPLRDGEADIAIFCLSLMGTNWLSFVEEAWRILRGDGKGEVWVAEVKSRFGRVTRGRVVENSVGKRQKTKPKKGRNDENADEDHIGNEVFAEDNGIANQTDDETDISAFVKVFERRGFVLRENSVNKSNKMFVSMIFVKSGVPTAGKHKGLKWNGHEYQRQSDGRMKFVDNDDSLPNEDEEAKVLKPCLYKTR